MGSQADVDLWVRADGPAWVDQVVPDMSKLFAEMGQEAAEAPQMRMTYSGWADQIDFAPDQFRFTPPEGAEQVASLMEAMQEEAGVLKDLRRVTPGGW